MHERMVMLQMTDPVLSVAAALSVQSPFTSKAHVDHDGIVSFWLVYTSIVHLLLITVNFGLLSAPIYNPHPQNKKNPLY